MAPRPLRLLFLCEGDAESATGSFSGTSRMLVHGLRDLGHEVVTCDVEPRGLEWLVMAASAFSPNRQRWSVRRYLQPVPFALRSNRAQGALTRSPGTIDAVLQIGATFRLSKTGGVPYFLYCDSNLAMAERGASTGYSWASSLTPRELRIAKERERQVYQGAAAVFTISEYLKNSFEHDFSIPADRVIFAGAGPNIDAASAPSAATAVRERLGPPTILFIGVQFRRKGGDLLLAAFQKVRVAVPSARLVLVGPKHLDVRGDGVEFLGFLSKDAPEGAARLAQAFSDANVFCLPTRYEPFGIAFVEAMLHGLPCVGTSVWAVPEMVIDGETGFLVPPDDVESLADRLIQLLTDSALARRMGARGRERALADFTWPKAVARISDGISAALGLGERR